MSPSYAVSVSLGTLDTEVEADNEDAAITAALTEWVDDADDIIGSGTFSVREICE